MLARQNVIVTARSTRPLAGRSHSTDHRVTSRRLSWGFFCACVCVCGRAWALWFDTREAIHSTSFELEARPCHLRKLPRGALKIWSNYRFTVAMVVLALVVVDKLQSAQICLRHHSWLADPLIRTFPSLAGSLNSSAIHRYWSSSVDVLCKIRKPQLVLQREETIRQPCDTARQQSFGGIAEALHAEGNGCETYHGSNLLNAEFMGINAVENVLFMPVIVEKQFGNK